MNGARPAITSSLVTDADELVRFLGDVALFKNVRDDYKRAIAPRLEPRFFNKGEAIVTEGEVGDAMYIVRQGAVSVLLTEPMLGLEMEIARLRIGHVFGEMSMLTAEPRSATVRAVEPTHALVLSRDTFQGPTGARDGAERWLEHARSSCASLLDAPTPD